MVLNKRNKKIFIFIMCDLLFLPSILNIPLSLPVLLYSIVMKKIKIKMNWEFLIFIFLFVLIILSTIISVVKPLAFLDGINIKKLNVMRALQIAISFIYYFSFKEVKFKYRIDMKKILFMFIYFYLTIGLIAYINMPFYFILRVIYGQNIEPWLIGSTTYFLRYSYLWGDPNNVAYAFQMILFYLLLNEKLSIKEKNIVYFSLVFSLIISMSSGAMLSAIIFMTIYFMRNFFKTTKIKISKKIFRFLILFLIISLCIFSIYRETIETVFKASIDRIFNNQDSGSHRINNYKILINTSLPKIIGEGYTIVRLNRIFKPHSDHFRVMYAYGILTYILLIFFLFRKGLYSYRYLFILPAFFAFSINSLIEEQKIFMIFMVLLSLTEKKKYFIEEFKQEGKLSENSNSSCSV